MTNTTSLINSGCFDLQFRKDIKHNRPHSPTYYRWKVQFVVIDKSENLEKVKKSFGCGGIHIIKNQGRYSVQNIDDLKKSVIPYFEKCQLSGIKKKDFELWKDSVEIIYKNKGKPFSTWKKEDFQQLIEIHKAMKKYKEKPKQTKWVSMAEDLAKTL
jgi:hypothetical protein